MPEPRLGWTIEAKAPPFAFGTFDPQGRPIWVFIWQNQIPPWRPMVPAVTLLAKLP